MTETNHHPRNPKYRPGAIRTAALALSLFLALPGAGGAAPLMKYPGLGGKGQALLCKPGGKGPFPAVLYNHGMVVDIYGYQGAASRRGYDMDGICRAFAKDGFLAFLPIRQTGRRNIPRHK